MSGPAPHAPRHGPRWGLALAAGALLLGAGAWLGWRHAAALPDLTRWDALIVAAAREQGLDPDLLRALVGAESGGDPEAHSRAGAVGLCQLLPDTAREEARRMGLADPAGPPLRDPALNLRLGASYLARLLRRFEGEVAFAVAAYNAGPTRVLRWRERAPDLSAEEVVWREGFEETRRHLQRVLRYREAYRRRDAP